MFDLCPGKDQQSEASAFLNGHYRRRIIEYTTLWDFWRKMVKFGNGGNLIFSGGTGTQCACDVKLTDLAQF